MKKSNSVITDISKETAVQAEEKTKIIDSFYQGIIDSINETLNNKEMRNKDLGTEIMYSALLVAWQVGRDNGYSAEELSALIKEFDNRSKKLIETETDQPKIIITEATSLN